MTIATVEDEGLPRRVPMKRGGKLRHEDCPASTQLDGSIEIEKFICTLMSTKCQQHRLTFDRKLLTTGRGKRDGIHNRLNFGADC